MVIGDGVPGIGAGAFQACPSLVSVVIPASVTSIENAAFYMCDALADVYYTGTSDDWFLLKMDMGYNNTAIQNATIHYNYVPD